MATMICSICHRYGIEWKYLSSLHPYTECPYCHNINCQRQEDQQQEELEEGGEEDGRP